jgi:hypothetical protein
VSLSASGKAQKGRKFFVVLLMHGRRRLLINVECPILMLVILYRPPFLSFFSSGSFFMFFVLIPLLRLSHFLNQFLMLVHVQCLV